MAPSTSNEPRSHRLIILAELVHQVSEGVVQVVIMVLVLGIVVCAHEYSLVNGSNPADWHHAS
jgi:hypothetical protein